jgi:8-oxo-dGTP diphosphatase
MVCCDCIVVWKSQGQTPRILLIERKNDPFKGNWALPGGFVDMDEDLEHAALRELEEETGISLIKMMQFAAYGQPGRDPRGRNISIVYYHVADTELDAHAGDDAAQTQWFDIDKLPALAFDHEKIIRDFIKAIN